GTLRTHFAFRVDTWTPDGESIVKHVAGVEDYQVALATYRAATPITLRQGGRVIEDSRRLRVVSSGFYGGRQTFVQKLRHDKRIQPTIPQSSRRFLLNSFSERSAMASSYPVATKKVPNPIDKHVGSRVRMRRLMLAMSQENLAAGLGLTFQQVQKY